MNGAGITYDDAANAVNVALQNLAAGNGIDITGSNISVVPDPASPNAVAVTAAGVAVTTTPSTDASNLAKLGTDNRVLVDPADIAALATVECCDAFGNVIFNAYP